MAGQKGRDVLVRIMDPGLGGYITVAGIRAKSISLNARAVDSTSADSPDGWRELLAGAGVKSASITGAGVFKDAASDALLRQAFFGQTVWDFRLVLPDFGNLDGKFLVEALDYSGDHDGEAAFSMTLSSAGALTFTAL